eukprot:Rmarinus@m.7070
MTMSEKCYYRVLGVPKSASSDEIKRAYRKLALQYHPDKNKESHAEAMFKEVTEAYEVLKDDNSRKIYDACGSDPFQNRRQSASTRPQRQSGAAYQYTQRRNDPFSFGSGGGGVFVDFGFGSAEGFGFRFHDPFQVFEEFFGTSDPFSVMFGGRRGGGASNGGRRSSAGLGGGMNSVLDEIFRMESHMDDMVRSMHGSMFGMPSMLLGGGQSSLMMSSNSGGHRERLGSSLLDRHDAMSAHRTHAERVDEMFEHMKQQSDLMQRRFHDSSCRKQDGPNGYYAFFSSHESVGPSGRREGSAQVIRGASGNRDGRTLGRVEAGCMDSRDNGRWSRFVDDYVDGVPHRVVEDAGTGLTGSNRMAARTRGLSGEGACTSSSSHTRAHTNRIALKQRHLSHNHALPPVTPPGLEVSGQGARRRIPITAHQNGP